MRILQHKSTLAGNTPREMDHVLPKGLQEHSAWEPVLSCEVLLWVLGTASSLWTAAQANNSVGFFWLPEDLSYAGAWSGCVSKAQDFLLGKKTSCIGLWLKPVLGQNTNVSSEAECCQVLTVSHLSLCQPWLKQVKVFLQWLYFVNQRLFQKVH